MYVSLAGRKKKVCREEKKKDLALITFYNESHKAFICFQKACVYKNIQVWETLPILDA